MKTIYKPWGKEEWLELNDKYCYKRIYINAGTKTSYQYHEKKLETNYLIDGTAEFWLENDEGVVEKTIEKLTERNMLGRLAKSLKLNETGKQKMFDYFEQGEL